MARKSLNPKKRFLILNRDNFTCQYCGLKAGQGVQLQIDHKKPISKGGDDSLSNLITSCFECNIGKGDMDEKNIEEIKVNTERNDTTKKELNKFFEIWNNRGYGNIDKNTTVLLSIFFKEKIQDFYIDIIDSGHLLVFKSEFDVFGFYDIESKTLWDGDCKNNMNYRLNYMLTEKLLEFFEHGLIKNDFTIKKFSYFYDEMYNS